MPNNILSAVRGASIEEIELAGLTWRIRRVASADLARVGFAWLAMATPDSAMKKNGKDLDLTTMLSRAKPDKLVELAHLKDAMIAAGLLAIGHEGEWDEVTITLKQSEEDADAGVLWIGSLPAEVDNELFTAIMNLSTDGGKAGEILSSFRNKSRDAGSSGRRSKKIRVGPGNSA